MVKEDTSSHSKVFISNSLCTSDPWLYLYCCTSIFPFGFLTNKDFLFHYIVGMCQKMFLTKTVLSI